MVRLNKIYTRTGDDGTTALASGARRSKADLRVEAYGAIDETNAAIGMARAALGDSEPALGQISSISAPTSPRPPTLHAPRAHSASCRVRSIVWNARSTN